MKWYWNVHFQDEGYWPNFLMKVPFDKKGCIFNLAILGTKKNVGIIFHGGLIDPVMILFT